MLVAWIHTLQYFNMKDGLSSLEATGPNPELSCNFFQHTWIFSLQYKDANRAEYEDTMSSIIPLESCLHLDPSRRITPKQALKHSLIRVIHLVNDIDTSSCRWCPSVNGCLPHVLFRWSRWFPHPHLTLTWSRDDSIWAALLWIKHTNLFGLFSTALIMVTHPPKWSLSECP